MKSLHKNKISIPELKTMLSTASTDPDKAELLNVTFSSFFTDDSDPLQTPTSQIYSSECPENFLCTPINICNLINMLPHNVSPGYDGITLLLLKATAASVA